MTLAYWSLLIGGLLLTMLLIGTFLQRLPFNGAMIYLAVGYVLGPGGLDVIRIDPFRDAGVLRVITEIALLISLFAIGLKLRVPIVDRRWIVPLRLAFLSMAVTVALIAVIGVTALDLPLGSAILLGSILAPTDPVLASEIQPGAGRWPDPTRFSLAAEGALNDGSAFPFVLLGLGLLGQHQLGPHALHWWLVDLLWATGGGLLIGAMLGSLMGNLVIYLRTRHHRAIGMDEFLALGVIAISYGSAQLCLASGFLAVFAAGLALSRVQDHPIAGSLPLDHPHAPHHGPPDPATHSHHATATMRLAVRQFNTQLERLVELAIVVVVGAMLPAVAYPPALWWFIPLLFLVVRPLAVLAGMAGQAIPSHRTALVSWFGIRGIGSVYYLMLVLQRVREDAVAAQFAAFTLATVAVSIVVHGISAHPLMRRYAQRESPGGVPGA
jgi:NhaP-type Na+/H+ or K+/H+ antiporter